ncbi:YraN family protein [Aliidiomarina celeris]|uniref:YraN family protein n=1 Tax=Aliidiomarina celeris TaxID=2249428 RepID=UPI000DE994DA|nr:YraN family protein [Aliidiomarina celeris]
MSTRTTGTIYENTAVRYLQQQGLTLVEQNFRLRDGEIDIIMKHGQFLVFIEVKYRRSGAFADILEQIQPAQLQRVRRSARIYLHLHGYAEHLTACRFDILAITGSPQDINWLQDAF